MSTATAAPPYRAILDDSPARGLSIPPPTGRLEKVVGDAVKKLEVAHDRDLATVKGIIEKYGLTIEVARLRDTLARVAATDLHRLLLSIPGVPEALFYKAIEKQLAEETKGDVGVTDASVASIGTQIGSAATSLTNSLSSLSTDSSRDIVEALEKLVGALACLKDDYAYKEPDPTTGASGGGPSVGKKPAAKKSPPSSPRPRREPSNEH